MIELIITVALALAVILLGEVFAGFKTMRRAREWAEQESDRACGARRPAPTPHARRGGRPGTVRTGGRRTPLSLPPQPLSDDDCYRLDPYGDVA